MKEIPCEDIDRLSGSDVYPEIIRYSKEYKTKSLIRSIFVLFTFGVSIAVFGGYLIQGGGIESYCCILDFPLNAFILAFTLFCILGFLYILIETIRVLFSRYPKVAKAIYFADGVDEVTSLTMPGDVERFFYTLFMGAMEKSFFRVDESLRSKYSLQGLYANGAVLAKTSIKVDPFSAHAKISGRPVELKEKGAYAIFLFAPDVIAVVDKKYKDEIIKRIEEVSKTGIVKKAKR